MRPGLLKKREASLPRSARRAIASAETGLSCLRVLFIQTDLLFRRSPQSDEVEKFSLVILTNFEDHGKQPITHRVSVDTAFVTGFRHSERSATTGSIRVDFRAG